MTSAAVLLLILLPFALFSKTLGQTPAAPGPTPAGPINITGLLEKGGQFTMFIRLLNETKINTQLDNQLNSTSQGMTILAPTDNAFNSLKPGALNALNDQQKSQLLLFHVLTQFYTLTQLATVSNPVRTLAGDWGLNFTGQANQVNVTTGVVTVPVNNKLREQSPLSIFAVEQVLLPEALFGNHTAAAPPPKSPAPASDSSPADGKTPPESDAAKPPSNDKGAAVRNGFGLGLVLGFGLIAINNFLF